MHALNLNYMHDRRSYLCSKLDKILSAATDGHDGFGLNSGWTAYDIEVKLSKSLPEYLKIGQVLKLASIRFTYFEPKVPTDCFDLYFSMSLDFYSLYAVMYLLRPFGLQSIFYGGYGIQVGGVASSSSGLTSSTKSISVEVALNFPFSDASFSSDIFSFVNTHFPTTEKITSLSLYYNRNKISRYITKSDGSIEPSPLPRQSARSRRTLNLTQLSAPPIDYKGGSSEDNSDDTDNERDNFNALTGGQYGDYDDWDGDLDSLYESIGR